MKNKTLSEKIFQGRKILSVYHHNKPMLLTKDVAKKIIDSRAHDYSGLAEANNMLKALPDITAVLKEPEADLLLLEPLLAEPKYLSGIHSDNSTLLHSLCASSFDLAYIAEHLATIDLPGNSNLSQVKDSAGNLALHYAVENNLYYTVQDYIMYNW